MDEGQGEWRSRNLETWGQTETWKPGDDRTFPVYSYAPNGDVLSMTDSVMGTWSYSYDDFNRLSSGNATAGVDNTLSLSWNYDRYGNRWQQNASGSGNISAVQPQLSFGNNNQVSGWSYDLDGNLTNDGRNSYTYDAEGRIVSLNGAPTYMYDAEGRRVAKYSGSTITSSYLLDLGGNQVTELNSSGAWVHSNAFAGGRLLGTYEGTAGPHPNTWHFHLTDWLGTNRMQTTAAGNNEEVCYSYPFGDGLLCTGSSDATEHHFTGKERDAESGNDYFAARYLNTNLGRFMTPDWAAKPTAVPYAYFGNPQSLNLYGYMRNDPLGNVDPDGHCDFCSWLVQTISTYMATHPDVAEAVAAIPGKIANSLGVKVSGGVGGQVGPGGAQLKGQATGYVSYTMGKGAGAGADVTGTAQLGPAGGSVNLNAPIVKDGQLANPIKDASVTGSGSLSGDSGKTEVEASTTGDKASVGGTYGEGLVGGVEISADTGILDAVQTAVGDAIQEGEQFFSDLQDSLTMGVGGSAGSQAPAPPNQSPQSNANTPP